MKWPFDQAPNVAAITTRQVIENGLPILHVTHYAEDDSWAFTCGTTNASKDLMIVGMGEALKLDPTISEVSSLLPGWSASRSAVGESWHQFEDTDDQPAAGIGQNRTIESDGQNVENFSALISIHRTAMSFFMTISGKIPSTMSISGVELIPVSAAQPYIASLENELATIDGAPVFLVHDMETDTSDLIVSELQDSAIDEVRIQSLRIYNVLDYCFKHKLNFRIWRANNDTKAFVKNSSEAQSIESALESLKNMQGAWWHDHQPKSIVGQNRPLKSRGGSKKETTS